MAIIKRTHSDDFATLRAQWVEGVERAFKLRHTMDNAKPGSQEQAKAYHAMRHQQGRNQALEYCISNHLRQRTAYVHDLQQQHNPFHE